MSQLLALALDLRRTRVEAFTDAWIDAEADAGTALRAWRRAGGRDRADSYAAYEAALDREERAAIVLAEASEAQRA